LSSAGWKVQPELGGDFFFDSWVHRDAEHLGCPLEAPGSSRKEHSSFVQTGVKSAG
jgi:hypothetical protein